MGEGRKTDPRSFGLSEEDLRKLGYSLGSTGRSPGRSTSRSSHRTTSGDTFVYERQPARGARRPSALGAAWVSTVALLLVTGWAASSSRTLPDVVPAAGPATDFSAARAMAQLVEVSQRPHPTGSPEHDRVRERLTARLVGIGLEPEVHVTTVATRDAATARAATVRNVIARIPGSASTGVVAIVAHYDSRPLSPGAADNGVGVAAVLEAVRALTASGAPRNDVVVLLADAGALEGLGVRGFLESHAWGSEPSVAIVVDALGGRGPALGFGAAGPDGGSSRLAAATAGASPSVAAALVGAELHPELAPFVQAGVPVGVVTALGGRARRGQPGDVATELSESTLQALGDRVLAAVRYAGGEDLASVAGVDASKAVVLPLPRVGTVAYPREGAFLFALATMGLWVALALTARGRGAIGRAAAAGLAVSLVTVGASAGLGRLLLDRIGSLHPELGALDTAFYADGPHVVALAAISVACAAAALGLARRWFRVDALLTGALVVPVVASVVVAFVSPPTSGAVQWPAIAALLGASVLALSGTEPRPWARVLALALAGASLLVLVPTLEVAGAVWTFRAAPALGALFGLSVLTLLPVLDGLARPRVWHTPAAALAVAALSVGITLPSLRDGATRPVPTTLVYLADEPAPSLLPRGIVRPEALDPTVPRTMDGKWLTVPGPGERWARSWVAEPRRGSTDPGVVLLPDAAPWEIAGSGPESQLAPPRMRVLESALTGKGRRVRVALASGLGGEMVGVHLESPAKGEIVGVGGVSLPPRSTAVRTLTHWGRPTDDELVVDVALASDATEIALLVVEHHLRPREVLIEGLFERPDSLVANAAAGSDRAIQRTRLTAPLPDAPATVAAGG